ncbi:MAG TPA: hypothetical protein VEM14_10435, partial [Gemmatimonadaceae bacterium]|nr:hypothetical protein [Gemmatimonadaceae bacterium]
LNLMELASLDGREEVFDSYARDLAREPLNPWLRCHYFLFLGEGFARFGRYDAAEDGLREASAFAGANQIHQVAFKAQSALENVRTTPRANPTYSPPTGWVAEDVGEVIRGISELRKAAVAASR